MRFVLRKKKCKKIFLQTYMHFFGARAGVSRPTQMYKSRENRTHVCMSLKINIFKTQQNLYTQRMCVCLNAKKRNSKLCKYFMENIEICFPLIVGYSVKIL